MHAMCLNADEMYTYALKGIFPFFIFLHGVMINFMMNLLLYTRKGKGKGCK